ncbi:MAG: ADP-ribosylglycohydrolase family protein [Deltaproteobacteria bacterium]|nr:ADP-ribosylglycohydrolase family protein [Deltaproteobacteria bacterium]
MNERARGTLLGLAVGDALGTTYEFEAIDQAAYPELATGPATDVVGGGPFDLEAGAITDDTQMAVCLARSLADHGRLDADDVGRRYLAWSQEAFDIGNQTRDAIGRIRTGTAASVAGLATWQQSGRRAAGNGSLMRTAPIAVALHAGPDAVIAAALADSAITHADPRCALACAAFDAAIAASITAPIDGTAMLAVARRAVGVGAQRLAEQWRAVADRGGDARLATVPGVAIGREDLAAIESAQADLTRDLDAAAAEDPHVYTPELHVHRTAGFVRVAFRLAFWHCVHTPSWRAALVDIASRGGDADTNAAIAGALLGARDGASAIPAAWVERVLGAKQKGSTSWSDEHHPRHLLALAE